MKDDCTFLKHILEEAEFLDRIKRAHTREEFLSSEVLKRAVVRSLEIIGEASKKLSAKVKEKYKQVEWKNIAGMRDKLIHAYFGVDYVLVWNVLSFHIPELLREVRRILEQEDC